MSKRSAPILLAVFVLFVMSYYSHVGGVLGVPIDVPLLALHTILAFSVTLVVGLIAVALENLT